MLQPRSGYGPNNDLDALELILIPDREPASLQSAIEQLAFNDLFL
jgi:hypothetical protein